MRAPYLKSISLSVLLVGMNLGEMGYAQISTSQGMTPTIEKPTVPKGGSLSMTATTHRLPLNTDTLEPNWGGTVRGIQAGLSVERTRFKTGERVLLYPRWENLNAEVPLAQGECQAPQPAIEIQDADHLVLRTILPEPCWHTHGWGPFALEKGKEEQSSIELETVSPSESPVVPPIPFALPIVGLTPIPPDLPGAGVYYLVSVWSPHVHDPLDPGTPEWFHQKHAGRLGSSYATARSLPVLIEITPKEGQ